jgi:hypothetical protein
MGNRANIVIVENHDWRLYYSHWAGGRILDALIGGPDAALRYVRSLRHCAKTEWTDPMWSDGGALIDLDRRRLLFFGDEVMVEMPIRRAMMTVLAELWPGFEIGWAYDATVELAGYVGATLRGSYWDRKPKIRLARDRDSLCHLVSVVTGAGELRLWPLGWDVSQAWRGPELLHRLPGRGVKKLSLNVIPEGGVHIDVNAKTIGAWHTADGLGIFRALPQLWSGWQTECWEDRYEEQVAHCDGALRVPALDVAERIEVAQEHIRKRVFQSFSDSPAGHIVALTELLAPIGPGMVVSQDATFQDPTRPRHVEWARFTNACDGLRFNRARSA